MSKYWIVCLLVLLTSCSNQKRTIPGTNITEKSFEMPTSEKTKSSRSSVEIEIESKKFNYVIGGWPPRFSSEEERDSTYERWSDVLTDAKALHKVEGDQERMFYLLGEIYRQGHNMDVKGAGELAGRFIEKCIDVNPRSVPCHMSSSLYYLSVSPNDFTLSQAERSLLFLRENIAPNTLADVERGFVFLYIYRKEEVDAILQIDRYLKLYPDSSDQDMFLKMKEALMSGDIVE